MSELLTELGTMLDEKAWANLLDQDEPIAKVLATAVAGGATAEEVLRFTRKRTGNDKLASWYHQAARHLVIAKEKPLAPAS